MDVKLGVFVECKQHLVNSQIKELVCINKNCTLYNKPFISSKFCQQCGGKLVETSIDKMVNAINTFTISTSIKEGLYVFNDGYLAKFDIWVSNRHFPGACKTLDCNVIEEVTYERVTNELKLFKDSFEKEIVELEKAYGKENVSIKWGVLTSYDN